MQEIYGSINFIISFLMLEFYNRFSKVSLNKIIIFLISIIYTIFRLLTANLGIEPIRIILSFLTIFTVKYLNSEKKHQQLLEAENTRLEREHQAIQSQLAELNIIHTTLKNDFGKVTSNYHNYKYVIPVLLNIVHKSIEELNQFGDYTNAEKSKWIRDYTEQFRVLSFDVSHDFIIEQVKSEIASLDIPANQLQLISLLEKLMTTAQQQEIYLLIDNQILAWDSVKISDTTLLRLMSNIVDNAIKESCKIPKEVRGEVRLTLIDTDGIFMFEVSDHANEFNLEILQKLGTRKNSTNGTGDGYSEIMAALNKSQASLIIKEWQKKNRFGKTISVIFDGYNMKLINSDYRQELLKQELIDSELEVLL